MNIHNLFKVELDRQAEGKGGGLSKKEGETVVILYFIRELQILNITINIRYISKLMYFWCCKQIGTKPLKTSIMVVFITFSGLFKITV